MMSELIDNINSLLLVREIDLQDIGGCGDGNCCISKPKGQHTNGGCRCTYYPDNRFKVERALRANQRFVDRLSKIIKGL